MSTLCFEDGFDMEYDPIPLSCVEPPEWDEEPVEEPSAEEMEEWEERRRRKIQEQQEH